MNLFDRKINIFIGHYGVGKTTLAVNFAYETRKSCHGPVSVADIDVNNPYFRSRDWAEKLLEFGIELIMPEQEIAYAEMPFLPKQIYAAFQKEGKLFLDVGGNDTGTTVLGSLADHLQNSDYRLWFVVNTFRPDMETEAEIVAMFERLQSLAKLNITGMINNSNLADWTTPEHLIESERIVYGAAEKMGVKRFVNCVENSLFCKVEGQLNAPVIPVQRLDRFRWQSNGGPK